MVKVTLMTLHREGLGFRSCLTGIEGVFPHLARSAAARAGGGTRWHTWDARARSPVHLARHDAQRVDQPQFNPASRFLDEMPGRWCGGGARGAYTSWSGQRWRGGLPQAARWLRRFQLHGWHAQGGAARRRLGIRQAVSARRANSKSVPTLVADRVSHQRWGLGAWWPCGHGVRARAQIDFGDQVMWIVLRHAPIEKCDGPGASTDACRNEG